MKAATLILWRLLLAAVFLLAAWGKWHSGISPFPQTIYDRLVQGHAWMHWAILGGEACLGLWLLCGWRQRAAAIVTLLVLLAMSGMLLREIASPDPLGCGCGLQPVEPGRGPAEVRHELLLALGRDLLLLLGAAYLAVMAPPASPAPRSSAKAALHSDAE